MSEFGWKDELLLREAAIGRSNPGLKIHEPAAGFCRFPEAADRAAAREAWQHPVASAPAEGSYTDPAAIVAMERFLAERDAKDEATRQAFDFRAASETWCKRAREYAGQRNALLWALACALGWAIGATWLLVKGA